MSEQQQREPCKCNACRPDADQELKRMAIEAERKLARSMA